jgi:hypothetical protein
MGRRDRSVMSVIGTSVLQYGELRFSDLEQVQKDTTVVILVIVGCICN